MWKGTARWQSWARSLARQLHGAGTLSTARLHPWAPSICAPQALKRVLPGEPADGRLRPYLPAVTKQAWHLDKQSLKGIKRQKAAAAAGAAGTAPACDGGAAAGDAGGSSSKENQQQQAAAP